MQIAVPAKAKKYKYYLTFGCVYDITNNLRKHRLEKEELELRLAASQSPKDDGKLTELAAEVQRAAAKEKETKAEMIILQVLVNWRVIINER